MSGAHEGCSQGKSVRDREGSKHSTAATPERVDSEAAVLPQDFEDTVHARQLKALCRRVGRRMSRQGPGRSPSMGLTHLNAARPREKSSGVPHCGSSKILSDLVSHRRATRPVIFSDSKSAVDMSVDPVAFEKTKHILRAAEFLRDLVAREVIALKHLPGKIMLADVLTKAVARAIFLLLTRLIAEYSTTGIASPT